MSELPPIVITDYAIPTPSWMRHRRPRLKGDTRRRRKRLRKKLAKKDLIKYGPRIRAIQEEIQKCVADELERSMCEPVQMSWGYWL